MLSMPSASVFVVPGALRRARSHGARALALALALAILHGAPGQARAQGKQPSDDPQNTAQPAQPAENVRSQLDLGAVQGLLAIQELDGWLLYDNRGQNPIARELVNPDGEPSRRWFYFIPAEGQPMALVHKVDHALFAGVPGRKLTYTGHRDLEKTLAGMLRGKKKVAMEYSPKAELPTLSRVDAGTVELVRGMRVKIASSVELVQVANSVWGPEGRVAHYQAAHHLAKLRDAALAHVAEKIRSGAVVTELDVQKFVRAGYEVRGLEGPLPMVAAGSHTANPNYAPTAESAVPIKEGDLLLIEMRARLVRARRPIFAETTWMAYVGKNVPERHAQVFSVVAAARDAALAYVKDRVDRRRAVRGFEVDRAARDVIAKAGHKDRFVHRTGHSLDSTLHSAGTNLDDYETRDTRTLVAGAGFAIAPGIYFEGEYGIRSAVNVHLGPGGVEVTVPAQREITPILGP